MNAKKTVGKSTTEYTSNVSGVSYKWGFDESGESGSGNVGDSLTFTSANAQAHHAVWLELYVNGTRADRETIPFVVDGRKGDNGEHGKYYKKQYAIGNSRTNHPTSGWQDTQPAVTDINPYLWERSRLWNPNTNNWDTGSAWVYVCLTGMDGRPGDLGPMCYIAGEYSDSLTYVRDTATGNTVAVEVPLTNGTSQIWVLEADSNVDADTGTHYRPSNDPDVNPGIWSMGLNSYNLIRTRYLFADFAKLGSGVYCGDWLFSAHGTINGVEYDDGDVYDGKAAYMSFDPDNPNTNNVTNFIPYFALDLKTGRVYLHSGYFRGKIYSSEGTIGGFTINSNQIKSTNDKIILNSNGTVKLTDGEFSGKITATSGSITGEMVVGNKSGKHISLLPPSVSTGNAALLIKEGNNVKGEINYKTFGSVNSPSLSFYLNDDEYSRTYFGGLEVFGTNGTTDINAGYLSFTGILSDNSRRMLTINMGAYAGTLIAAQKYNSNNQLVGHSWPTNASDVALGGLYVDGSGYLRVKTTN